MTRRKKRSASSDAWTCGFVCAAALVARENDPLHTDVITLLEAACATLEKARNAGADASDIEQLTPAWTHIAEKDQRWANRSTS